MSQGANPWSDLGSREAMRLLGSIWSGPSATPSDREAREETMWAATLAGIAFGNAGVHIPHAMSYAVAGQVRGFHPDGYPGSEPLVPHGMSVILNAPSVFRFTASTNPQRHIEAARHLGADVGDVGHDDAGTVLAEHLIRIMRAVGMPNGLSAVGYAEADCATLADGAWPQQRLLQNAPIESEKSCWRRCSRALLGIGDSTSVRGLRRSAPRFWRDETPPWAPNRAVGLRSN